MMKQLHAGYVLGAVRDYLLADRDKLDWSDVLRRLSAFSLDDDLPDKGNAEPIAAVLANIISRGLPTLPSIFIEDTFSNIFRITRKIEFEKTGELKYIIEPQQKGLLNLVRRSFALIDPRLETSHINEAVDHHHGSDAERNFYNSILPSLNGPYILQLITGQREISSLVSSASLQDLQGFARKASDGQTFFNQKVDFSLELPTAEGFARGLVIEIDGPQHDQEPQKTLDDTRDRFLSDVCKTITLRIKTNEIDAIPTDKVKAISDYMAHPYSRMTQENYVFPLYKTPDGLDALQIALTPFAVARLQRSVIEAVLRGAISFDDKVWRIAVIERDVPCAKLAMDDLVQMITKLTDLQGRKRAIPQIELRVFNTVEFTPCKLSSHGLWKLYGNNNEPFEADLLLDISMLQRPGFTRPLKEFCDKITARHTLVIRSVMTPDSPRTVSCSKPIQYSISEERQLDSLRYFLRNIFRKLEFREGQIEILKRTLSRKDVIALLPTGAGKSLTYQLSVLLQPGVALIVDPLKSLMRDQDQNLRDAGIDGSVFINSTIKDPTIRKLLGERMKDGWYQFVFISPERLQIKEFRDQLGRMEHVFVTYCVVDEAHCVSEWGHDFRTSYLRLGVNARKYCKTPSDEVPIIALTGTASFDVLADVQRELDIKDENAIVAPSEYRRKELHFEIKEVVPELPDNLDAFKTQEAVALSKQDALVKLLDSIPEKYGMAGVGLEEFLRNNDTYPNTGLIFCPHVNWVFGVKEVLAKLKAEKPGLDGLVDLYAGKIEDDGTVDLEEIQNKFKKDQLRLLVATKAFGMGIDKPNIRFTVHFNMPQSIESFYQEAGRAGRDRDPAYCFILYSRALYPEGNGETVDRHLMTSFHHNAFRGIEKEKRVLYELLREIRFPPIKQVSRISDLVLDERGIVVNLSVWTRNGIQRLYVNGEEWGKKYGYIDIISGECRPSTDIVSAEEANSILQFIKDKVNQIKPAGVTLAEFVRTTEYPEPAPGIENILSGMRDGDSRWVVIGFSNDYIRRIVDLLQQVDPEWNETMILQANNFCFSAEDFLSSLKSEFRKATRKNANIDPGKAQLIKQMFTRIRDDSDTSKAIYRLSVIGAIEDYEIDYRTRTITAKITKHPEEYYIDCLHEYISRYLSREQSLAIRSSIYNQRGETIIQKCLGVLVDFVYDKIAKKRMEAINSMEGVIKVGINGKSFEEEVNTYFDSRYTPLLRPYLTEYDISLVWEFIGKTGGDPDAVKHLRGACNRLLVENPDNAAFLLLRSASRFLIPQYEKSDALADFKKGWALFREQKNWTREDYLRHLTRFIQHIIDYDTRLIDILGLALIQEHANWLRTFNTRFLSEDIHA